MNIRDLQYLVMVAQEKSFVKAADKLFVSQPTLSMQIKKLEEELRVVLFERDKRTLYITSAGQVMVEYAKEILKITQEMKNAAQYYLNPLAGVLKLALFPTLAPYLLPKVIYHVKQALPELKVEIFEYITQQCITGLLAGELDAILIANQLNESKLVGTPLFTEEFYFVCPLKHELANSASINAHAFPEHELLLLEEGHCLRDQSLDFCHKIGKNTRSNYSGTSLNTVVSMVSLGEGVTLIPALAVDSIKHLPIKIIPFTHAPPTRTVYLYHRKTTHRDNLFKQLSIIIRSSVSKQRGVSIIK